MCCTPEKLGIAESIESQRSSVHTNLDLADRSLEQQLPLSGFTRARAMPCETVGAEAQSPKRVEFAEPVSPSASFGKVRGSGRAADWVPPPTSEGEPTQRLCWCKCFAWVFPSFESHDRQWSCWLCGHRLGRDNSSDSMEELAEPDIERVLRNVQRFLDILFLVSVIVVLSSPACDWFRTDVALGPSAVPEPTGMRRLDNNVMLQLTWTAQYVVWPPFFEITAAALGATIEGGRLLHAASDTVLRTLILPDAAIGGESARPCENVSQLAMGPPFLLPEAARGLSIVGGELYAVGDAAVHSVPLELAPDGPKRSVPSGSALLELARAADSPLESVARLVSTHKQGPLDVAAALHVRATLGGPTQVAAVLARKETSGVYFAAAAAVASAAGGDASALQALQVLAHLGALQPPVLALHVAEATADRAPILWAVVGGDRLVALDLVSGRLLATCAAPSASALSSRFRGWRASAGASSVTAITGNATHLVVVLPSAAAGAGCASSLVLSAPYPEL